LTNSSDLLANITLKFDDLPNHNGVNILDGKILFHPSLNQRAAAWRLLGETLDSGWIVVEALGWDPMDPDAPDKYYGTGGNFSVPYKVKRNGVEAFSKGTTTNSL
jgi:hypothetical protein